MAILFGDLTLNKYNLKNPPCKKGNSFANDPCFWANYYSPKTWIKGHAGGNPLQNHHHMGFSQVAIICPQKTIHVVSSIFQKKAPLSCLSSWLSGPMALRSADFEVMTMYRWLVWKKYSPRKQRMETKTEGLVQMISRDFQVN